MSPSPVQLRRAALAVPCCLALILGGAAAHHPPGTGQQDAAASVPAHRVAPFPHTPIGAQPTDPTTHAPARPAHQHAATKHTSSRHTNTRHSTATTSASGSSSSQMAYAVLNLLNSERAKHNLPALRMNSRLISSAHTHNLAMAAHNTMSHQLPGEASFSTRISRAGYSWRAAGENIGWNSSMSTSAALYLERLMYDEGSGGGHYENIVSTTYRDVGVDVYLDQQHHKLWLTEDFGRAA